LYDTVNVTLDPSLIKLFFNGTFNVVKCPECESKGYVDKWFLFHDMKNKKWIEVKKGKMRNFLNFLQAEGYFDDFYDDAKLNKP